MENITSLVVSQFKNYLAEKKMQENTMITELTATVKHLKRDVESLKENNKYLYSKLDKAYEDRIALRAENHKLKNPKVEQNFNEEEECLTCSA